MSDISYYTLVTLKQSIDKLARLLEQGIDDCKGCSSYFDAMNNAKNYRDDKNKYKQALEEIREVADKEFNNKDFRECDSSFWLIKNKIDEVLR